MIAVVDYHKGNLKSVERGLTNVGADVLITDDPATIARSQAIVLPGVGAFCDAATTMEELGQTEVIRDRIKSGVPFLGICLGLHLMFEEGAEVVPGSDEQERCAGLGLLPGVVYRMPKTDALGNSYKIPHVGWNTIESLDDIEPFDACPLLFDIPVGEYFYFTHSFIAPSGDYTCATTTHSVTFPSVVQYNGVAFGVQFHPEKSSDAGVVVLKNFVELAKEG